MTIFTMDDYGRALTHEKIVPGNTLTSLNREMYVYTERDLVYTTGDTAEIVAGDWIVGQTSTAFARVVSITTDSGAWTGTAAGTMRICSQHGTFQAEDIGVGAAVDNCAIAANSVVVQAKYPNKGLEARAALVAVLAQTALCAWDGSRPDQTSLVGISIGAGSSIMLTNIQHIRNFRCIDAAAGSASTINVAYYF